MAGTGKGEVWSDDFLPDQLSSASVAPLGGGAVNSTWLVDLTDGRRVVVKAGRAAPDTLFTAEAAGLEALRQTGGLHTPQVLHAGRTSIVLEALDPSVPDTARYWEQAGRAVAGLHAHTSPRHGWNNDGWLGWLRQENAWDEDGYQFFATRRILRYLKERPAQQVLDAADRAGLERLCLRLPQLLPGGPAVLTHGDLWRGNMVTGPEARPVFIDPAVCYAWAEADLSMMYCEGAPERFFDAYHELHPPPAEGWRERMELLHLRELLSVVAHFGPAASDWVVRIRAIIKRYS